MVTLLLCIPVFQELKISKIWIIVTIIDKEKNGTAISRIEGRFFMFLESVEKDKSSQLSIVTVIEQIT